MNPVNLFISAISGSLVGVIYALIFTKKFGLLTEMSNQEQSTLATVLKSVMNIFIRYGFLVVAFLGLVHFLNVNLLICATCFIVIFWVVLLKRMKRDEH